MTNILTLPNFFSRLKMTAIAVFVATLFGAWANTSAQTVGYHDYSFGSTISAPTDSKPESKVWFNDGVWWGVMFNPSLQGFDIYRLDLTTQTWTDTGTAADDRATSRADALWDQAAGKLYIVSNLHVDNAQPNNTSSNWGRLYRYSYNAGTQTYSLDSGYPVTVTKGKEETLTIAKDSNGKLWVTYVEAGKVMINHSNGSDNVWGTPTALPVGTTATTVTTDDIATIISFGGNKIGVYWSNQSTNRDYFAIHPDSNADATWLTEETAWGNGVNCTGLCADDHINIKADSTGKIYVAIKTSFTNTTDPFIVLVTRNPTTGAWSSFTESQHANTNTRGIVVLDEPHNRLFIFVSSNEAGGDIDYKSTSMSSPSFVVTGQGDQFISNTTDTHINNATSSKQNLTSTTGLLVLAGDDTSHFYVHNYINLGTGPTITSFTPTSGLSGTSVVLTGLKFTGATSVKFNGVSASFTVNSDSQITTSVPSSATSGAITVTTSGGTGTSGSPFNVTLAIPHPTSFTPLNGIVGTSVVITGTNFVGITGVAFNGVPVPSAAPGNFVVNSSTKITTPVPSGASTGKITVTNSGGTGTTSSSFSVLPSISSLSPASGSINLPVTINGEGFTGTTSVKFNSNKTATFSVVSSKQINTTVPTNATTGAITVTTPAGTATSASFPVVPPATFTSFSPTSGPVGTVVTLNGTNLSSPYGVTFNGTAATFTAVSSTKITATVPSGVTTTTTGPITINAQGGPVSSPSSFMVTPAISSFSPTSGGTGTVVTITGTSFTGATAVKFAGTTAAFNVTNDSQISATVPSGATNGTLAVTTPGGTGTSSGSFTVLPPPSITSFTPGGGAVGTAVTITGTNFGATQGTSTVKFNGITAAPASPASNWSNTSITVLVPANATIGPITLTTSTGVGTSGTNFVPAPVISSFAPTSGVTGTSVVLGGINFTGATAISFNGGVATTFTVDSDTSIHASVPATGTTGPISVTTPNGGTGSSATNFTVNPLINTLTPNNGSYPSSVTIAGSGFGSTQGASTVTFNGTSAGAATSWGPTSITVQVPQSLALGNNTVLVTVSGVNSNGLNFTVTSPLPIISSFAPFEAVAGTTVTINGTNFSGTTAVSFNGTAASSFTILSSAQITATVPSGATSGPISVTNGFGTALSASNFTVSTLVRNMTFENGALIDVATGADNTGGTNKGSLVVDTVNALKGIYSAHVPGISDAYLTKAFSPTVDDLYETFYLRVNATHTTAALVAQLTASGSAPAGGTLGEIRVTAANNLQLTRNGTLIGAAGTALTVGQPYRILLHQKKGTGSNAIIEAFLAQGDNPFTTAFASTTTDTFTNGVASLKIGNLSTTTNTIDLSLDNVQLDSAIPQGQAPPLITSLTPNSGQEGTVVTIAGLHFGATTGAVTFFNGIAGTPTNWTDTSITVPVPTGATTGPVVVTNTSNVSSNGVPFTVGGTISGVSPASGATGATVTISGTNLSGATQVTFNGTPAATPYQNNTATQIVVTVPGGATTGPIVVTTPNGNATSPSSFTVVPAPAITNLSSLTGAVGQSITITGTNFGPTQVTNSSVTFNGTAAPVTSWSDTSIVVPVPAGATTGNVVVFAAGVASNNSPFTVIPNITGVNPSSAAVGATVTIAGTSFGASQSSSTVTFGGATATVNTWSDTSISVIVPSGTGTQSVVVTVNTQPSNGFSFNYIPPPSITNLSAGSGYAGSSITITGTSFGATPSSSTVTFNGATAVVNNWSDTSLAVTVPAAATTGNVVVTVGGVASNGVPFTVLPNITGVSPSSGPANTAIIINGTRFGSPQGTSTVTVNGTLATVSNWSDTSISATVPVGAPAGVGSVVVTVGGQPSNGFTFNVIPPPSISGVSPASSPAGTSATVQGVNFGSSQGSSTVTFNGTLATVNGIWTDTSIPVIVPGSLPQGSAPVVVTVSNQPSNPSPFTVVPNTNLPHIDSFTPTSGTNGTVVTIAGLYFSGTTAVKFNGAAATTFNPDSDTQITVVVPAGATTGPISVTNGVGTTLSSTNFTVTLIKFSTFEAGTLTDPATGVSSTTGTGNSIDSVTPLKSAVSAHVNGSNSYLTDTFAGQDDVYASFYLRLNALPTAALRIAMLSDGGTTVGNFNLNPSGSLTLRNSGTNFSPNSAALVVGQIYRVAIHQKKGTGANAILEGFVAQGDAPFGVPFVSNATGTWTTQADTFKVGATIATAVDLTVDNIQIDTTLPMAAPSPSITAFSPTHGLVGDTVTISGTNFGATQSGGSVKFNGTTAAVSSWSSTSIVVTVPASATFGLVTVTTGGGTASTSSLTPSQFTVDSAIPTISGFSPSSGPVGTQITINGTNLSGATSVTVAGTAAAIGPNSATQITITVANGTTGSGPIVVNTPGGQATSSSNFTVGAAPIVTSFTPTAGVAGASVVITGTGFTGATAVKFNGTAAVSPSIDNDGQITAMVPNGATSGLISVTTPNGTGSSVNPFTVGVPTVASFTPSGGPAATSVTITGTNFGSPQGSSTVKFGATLATGVTNWSDTSITVPVPAGASTSTISVTTAAGTGTSANSFTVGTVPVVNGFNPTGGPVGTSVTITGSAFGATQDTSTVKFNGTIATGATWSDTSIIVPVPAGATTGTVSVTTGAGTGTSSGTFTVGPPPTVSGFNPTGGQAGTSVTVTGTGFGSPQGTSVLKFGATQATSISNWTDTSITAVVPAGASTGAVSVTTATGTGASGTSFVVAPAPTISSFTPNTGVSGTSVVISGAGFTGATAVKFNGTAATPFSIDNDGQITTTVPAGATSGLITVTTATGTGTSANSFTVGAPTITTFNPTGGPVGTSVVITGTNFGFSQASSTVKFGTITASPTAWTGTSITVPVPATAITGTISVTTAAGTGTSANSFTVGPVPVVSNFTPAGGPAGTSVTITGSGFGSPQGTSTLSFGATQATSISNWTDTSITALVPAGAITGAISVTTGAGTGTSANNFVVGPPPNVTGFTPQGGPGGTSVTITGTNFGATQGSVSFNGTAATVGTWTDTQITTTVPAAATSGAISVTGATGTGISSTPFTVGPAPIVSGFNPTSGAVGASIAVSGSGFTGATSVKFAGTPASFSVVNDGQINATVPVAAANGQISVTTVTGTGTSSGSFTVLPPAPVISSFTPTSGPNGTQVTITGTNLANASAVSIAGVAATINSNSASQILATVNVAGPTQGLVAVTTPGGSTDSTALSPQNFTVTVTPPPLPSITSFSPTSGASGTLVTINGVNFTGTNNVSFNGVTAAFTFVNDSQVTATVPAGATTGPISLTTGSGTTNTNNLSPANFTVGASTRIKDITFEAASLTGTSGFASTTGTVALETASPLKGVDSMTINGGNSYGTQSYTATDEIFISLYVRLASVPTSQVRVVRITDGGTSVGAITLETTGKITLRNGTTSIAASASALVPGTLYRIGIHQKKGTGANAVLEGFLATGDAAFTTPFATSNSLTFTSQADSVQIGASTSAVGNIMFDDIRLDTGAMPGPSTAPLASAPSVTGFNPTSGPVGTSVTIAGTNFGAAQGSSLIKFGVATASSVASWSDTSITATVPAGAVTGTISVTTAAGTGTSSSAFTVTGGGPAVTSFNPTSGAVGASVVISGSGFSTASGVTFSTTAATSFVINNDGQITATVPSGATSGQVSVTNGSGTGTSASSFTVIPPPSVTSFNPTSGLVGASVVISGSAFTGATSVSFNGTSAGYTVNNDGQITATVPAAATSGSISVTTTAGTGTSSGSFTVTPPAPAISNFTPTNGPAGTTQVTINGTNLANATSVTIGGVAAAINTGNASQILATVGASATTGPISVTTPGGTANTTLLTPANFTVVPPSGGSTPPSITSFTPTSGGVGTVVTINGANFTGTNNVNFNGVTASFSFVSDSQLTATVPGGSTTGQISVTNGTGSTNTNNLSPANFTVTVGNRLKDITFEAASLTGASGFALTTGTVTLEVASPIKGADSMTISAGNSYGTQTYTATDEIFISLYVKLPAIPTSQARVIRITDGGTSVGAITLETTGKITLRNGTTSLGASATALAAGTVYRIGIHQKKGTGSNGVLEGFLATGDAAFATPFATNSAQTFTTQADSVQIGSSTGTVVTATFDDIRLDTGAMPGPSIP